MKSVQKHIIPYFRYSLILSGIVLCSLLPFEIHFDGNNFADLAEFATEYLSENDGNASEEKDVNHSNHIFELVFKETPEKKESSKGMSSLAILKQGITATEVGFNKLTLNKSYFFKRTKYLSIDYSLALINKTVNHLSLPFQPFISSIAINAP